MAIGSGKDIGDKPVDEQGEGQSAGIPAAGEVEGNSFSPMGNPGMRHWQTSFITEPGLGDRGNIFFAAVQMTRMPMVVTDPNQPDNPIVFVNRAFLDLTEYEEGQVIGRNCRFLQGKETNPATVAEVRSALSEQRAVAVDILNYKASGKPFWNALFIGPIFDQNGKLLYYFASQLDITRRRVSEQSYLQAQKMEAIGQLTAGLAHDFNNLLQVASGNQEMALELLKGNNEGAVKAIERAQSAIEKASKLTQQLLTFARKQRLEPKRVNLNALVVEFSEMLIRTLGERVDLHLDLKPGVPSCELDPTHLEMALLNVLINARDAMPQGGRVTIGTSVLTDKERIDAHGLQPGVYVVICIIDEGEGMAPEVARRATEPFFTTKGPGTGLGLAMVHGFVQQSHGRLEIDSMMGKGTTIRMIFPVSDRSAFEMAAERLADQQAGNGPNWNVQAILERKTILVVDDSQDIRELSQNFLQSLGYRVLAAASGEEALGLLDRYGNVDLLFTDVIMPGGMNGLQLMQRVRERQPDIPVLIATGYMDDLSSVSGAASLAGGGRSAPEGPLNILPKPFRFADLAERVRSELEAHPPRNPVRDFRHEG
ncbi:PAS domain S-box-containing protein [Noviherbaspirillum humi]|uniref:histidine kinase n=1 Tax=Noviherbaspirillum humi TaxID=1688639 RepID=A0A239F278_9BURK|nr:histidine kinase famiy protein [Noviherbaspirillum humi]SNS51026.1 PAS domain S-box-containing protein [Noviherbaspirillum humi]